VHDDTASAGQPRPQEECIECRRPAPTSLCAECCSQLASQLGMPDDKPPVHIRIWMAGPGKAMREVTRPAGVVGGEVIGISSEVDEGEWKQWGQYEAHLFGVDLGLVQWPESSPLWLFSISGELKSVFQIWRRRVGRVGSSVRLEMTWHPDRGDRIVMSGLETEHKKRDIDDAWRGLKLFADVMRLGRPQNTGLMSEEQFRQVLAQALRDLRREGRKITQLWVAQSMAMDRSTLLDYFNRYGVDWQQVRNQLPG
jgi:hypothetical protein